MPSLASLDAAAQERKARLAKLKNLKRKQPDPDREAEGNESTENNSLSDSAADRPASKYPKSPSRTADSLNHPAKHGSGNDDNDDDDHAVTSTYLSGRNYDPETRGPRLGFEVEPAANQPTLEADAVALAAETRKQAEQDAQPDKPLDLFTLRPKKPNWDLKRDLEEKLQVLNVRTENAMARLVRERIEEAKKTAAKKNKNKNEKDGEEADGEGDGEGEAFGMDGTAFVEAMHQRERKEEEDERREKEDEEMDDGS